MHGFHEQENFECARHVYGLAFEINGKDTMVKNPCRCAEGRLEKTVAPPAEAKNVSAPTHDHEPTEKLQFPEAVESVKLSSMNKNVCDSEPLLGRTLSR